MTSREVLSIHIGQAGVQLGSHVWQLYCLEHGILPSGTMPFCPLDFGPNRGGNFTETIFREHERGTYVPRAIFIDLEPTCIDTIRTGCYRHLFHPDSFVAGKEDAGNNFARGYYTLAQEYNGACMERIRTMAEQCDSLQGFNVFRSIGGGCGSGVGSSLVDKLDLYFGPKPIVSYDIMPSRKFKSEVVEPYNAILSNHTEDGRISLSFIFDNESVSDICYRRLGVKNPLFCNYNRLLAHVISGMTSMMRFEGVSFTEFQTNLVPFPRVRYSAVSASPILTPDLALFEEFPMLTLMATLFDKKEQLLNYNPIGGKYMAMSLTFRGNVSPHEVNTVQCHLQGTKTSKPKIRFVNWAPRGFKVNLSSRPAMAVPELELGASPKSVVAMMNSTGIAAPWECLRHKFAVMWKKRAFVHWYLAEGMEEIEFIDAHTNMKTLQNDYADMDHKVSCSQPVLDLSLYGQKLEYTPGVGSSGTIPAIVKTRQPPTFTVKGKKVGQGQCVFP